MSWLVGNVTAVVASLIAAGIAGVATWVWRQTKMSTQVFRDPSTDARVGFQVHCSGHLPESVRGATMWLVVQPLECPFYHPQTNPTAESAGGTWEGTAFLGAGEKRDIGQRFQLHLVRVTQEGSHEFARYLGRCERKGSYPGMKVLPVGSTKIATVSLTRR